MTRRRATELLAQTEYDVVIVGTGLCESILAASLALAGSTVLHLDSNDFYGGAWATLPLSRLDSIITESSHTSEEHHDAVFAQDRGGASRPSRIEAEFGPTHEQVDLLDHPLHSQLFPRGVRPIAVADSVLAPLLPGERSRIWLDIVPRPILAAGAMVDLLVRTNVGHYIDFRALDALYVELGDAGGLQRVPSSRSDVFQNRFISMLEKRLLMRFVRNCYESADDLENADTPDITWATVASDGSFMDAMSAMGLTETLQQFLTHSIAFCSGREGSVKSGDGIEAVRLYQQSMTRFGTKTPFLYPNYGSGELSQAFCRLCAVHGGVYVLRRGAAAIVRETAPDEGESHNEVHAAEPSGFSRRLGVVTAENELIKCKHVFLASKVAEGTELVESSAPSEENTTWRLMAVVDGTISREAGMKRIMVTVPRGIAGNETSAVRIRQLDSSVMVCPDGFFVLYAETIEPSGSEADVLAVLYRYVESASGTTGPGDWERGNAESLVTRTLDGGDSNPEVRSSESETKPRILWGVLYSIDNSVQKRERDDGIVLVAGPTCEHDTDHAIEEAKRCFRSVHPEDKFFAMPKPETEVNVGAEETSTEATENGFHDSL